MGPRQHSTVCSQTVVGGESVHVWSMIYDNVVNLLGDNIDTLKKTQKL
jgi:hypothetical protein